MAFQFNYSDLGVMKYHSCWDLQEKIFAETVGIKSEQKGVTDKNDFLLVEHPHVYTLGKSGDEKNLLANADFLKQIGATFIKINRGGDITYHGPGQLVGYPIVDLEYFRIGIREYIEKMEEAIILTLNHYGIKGERNPDATGVWIDTSIPHAARKICAIGVRVSRFVTMHGFALNANTDLKYFGYINPCGLTLGVTSINKEIGEEVDMNELKEVVKRSFNSIFDPAG